MPWITIGLVIWFVIAIAVAVFTGKFIHFGNPTDEVPIGPGQLLVVYGENPCGCVVTPREYSAVITPCAAHNPEFVSEWELRIAQ